MQNNDKQLEEDIEVVMYDIIDEVTLGLIFDVHRSCKLGTLFLGDTDPKSQKEHEIVDRPGVDVFGNVPAKKQLECTCPNCQRNLAASRFAPHLEKCMGMGRNSSRIASRRSQKALKENEARLGADLLKRDSGDSEDDYNDVDWTLYPDKRLKRLRKEKRSNSPRRNKNARHKNGIGDGLVDIKVERERSDTPDSLAGYDYMTLEEKKTLLMTTCGVISGHTKKMCTRSHKCPQHTDEQRRHVRQYLIGSSLGLDDDDQVDIDTYVDGDSQSLRESLQWEVASASPSPSDSVSTNNSSSSKKRHGKSSGSKSKKRKTLKPHGLTTSHPINSLYEFD